MKDSDKNNPNVVVFNQDVLQHGGYRYTKDERLSCRLATQRTTDIILETGCFRGRSVLDMGCGDGHYSLLFWDAGKPRAMVGVDAAEEAIRIANEDKQDRAIEFVVGDVHHLPYPDNHFDMVLIQSILHHDDDPLDIIREGFRLAPEILIHEPNGNNFGLKVIEKVSKYHREHHEKSYTTNQLKQWIRQAGGEVRYQKFAGFVPMFCPDWLARVTKTIEPVIENVPVLKNFGSAVVVLIGNRRTMQ